MSSFPDSSADTVAVLTALANGIVPADGRDAGAAVVRAGERLAAQLAAATCANPYEDGLIAASELALARFGRKVTALEPAEIHSLLEVLRESHPAFFRQLRSDVCTLYLGDAGVWSRIGFPGPSTAQGGYPDFDQPQ